MGLTLRAEPVLLSLTKGLTQVTTNYILMEVRVSIPVVAEIR